MKKSLLFLMLSSIVLIGLGFPEESEAKKRYRYIKREHGLKVQGNLNTQLPSADNGAFVGSLENFALAYSWNFKGMIEVGPHVELQGLNLTSFHTNAWDAGIHIDYNIIKNRGKRKYIPAVGLKMSYGDGNYINTAVSAALKTFVGHRTPIYLSLDYRVNNLLGAFRGQFDHGLNVSVGIGYYFDFY